ncbi:MAG: APC family permease, partial [Parasporobacterium sp.]|nr:APC family permease [Parasporobacterium sp.]
MSDERNVNAVASSDASNLEQFNYKQELNRVMGLPSVCFFGIAYIAPITIFTTYGIITQMTHGMLSLAYLVATTAMIFTALSYRQMVKAFPIAGSVYAYAQRSISPYLGFLSGWAIILDYILLPMFNYVAIGLYMSILIPSIPATVWMLIAIIIVSFTNIIGINFTKIFNNTLIVIQLIFFVAVLIFTIKYVTGGNGLGTFGDFKAFFNSSEFNSPEVGIAGIFGGASILCMSFRGFDSVTTIAEETINPSKTIGRALVIVCLGAGITFICTSYMMQSAWPEAWFSFENADTGAFEYMVHVISTAMGYIFSAMMVVGATASAVAAHASATRILFGMGRDGLLPKKFFGHVSKKTKVPVYNTILISVVSCSCLLLDLTAAASLINFGALLGFTMVNVSVIAHYYVRGKNRGGSSIFKYLIF